MSLAAEWCSQRPFARVIEEASSMEMLSEDPTYLAGGLGLLAMMFLVALRVTQQGKFLIWAMIAGGIALLILAIEWIWVTDNERIEAVVYELRKAVQASDADGVIKHLTPDIQYEPSRAGRYLKGPSISGPLAVALIKSNLSVTHFDFVRITRIVAHAAQTRRGTADFQVLASGSTERGGFTLNFGSAGSTWSLGFRETKPNVWQVERISPVQLPDGAEHVFPSSGGAEPKSRPRFRLPELAAPGPAKGR